LLNTPPAPAARLTNLTGGEQIMENYFPQEHFKGRQVHLGVTGSIAAYKALDLLRGFRKAGLRVSVTLTEAAARFVTPLSFKTLGAEIVYTGMFPRDTADGFERERDVLGHLTPGAVADAMVILPASATTIARLAAGLADEILSGQALAFPKPIILAPAMNPRMWSNPATQENIAALRRRGHVIVGPDDGLVACNESGAGRLADLRLTYLAVLASLSPQDLQGKKLALTMGPTREAWDSVRFWSNHSTGLMGACLAVAARLRGAEVHAVCGPGCPWLPPEIERYDVTSAREMNEAMQRLWPSMDYGVFSAAVADFYPLPFGDEKFKKTGAGDELTVRFGNNPDILAGIGKIKKAGQKVVGFAAESSNLKNNVREKLKRKNADLLVGNLINSATSGFATPLNEVFVADRRGVEEHWPTQPKAQVAWRILDWLTRL
jgi:phosphopantothenoylcysteine decarboxylase/phosphopantothenate--cysteine ligase